MIFAIVPNDRVKRFIPVEPLDGPTIMNIMSVMGVAAAFIKIDAEVHRVKNALKSRPRDEALKKELNGLIKARETLLLEVQRKARSAL